MGHGTYQYDMREQIPIRIFNLLRNYCSCRYLFGNITVQAGRQKSLDWTRVDWTGLEKIFSKTDTNNSIGLGWKTYVTL